MNQNNETNNFDGMDEESGNHPASSNTIQSANDLGEATGTLNGVVAGAMIGSPFGLVGAVIGGVSGGAIGNQMVEGDGEDRQSDSKNRDASNNDSLNE